MATELDWLFYHYGPYATELEPALEALGDDVGRRSFQGRRGTGDISGFRYYRTGSWREVGSKMQSEFGDQVTRTVDRVLDRWALEPLWVLIDYVYFETEPMIGASRGDHLDLLMINREPIAVPSTAKLQMKEGTTRLFRERLGQASREVLKPPKPKPR